MPEIEFQPSGKKIKVKPGTSLLAASRQARAWITTRCGGKAACLMCKVKVEDQSHLSLPNENERLKLGNLIDEQYRLSCQAKVRGGNVIVQIPEDRLKLAVKQLLEKQQKERDDDLW